MVWAVPRASPDAIGVSTKPSRVGSASSHSGSYGSLVVVEQDPETTGRVLHAHPAHAGAVAPVGAGGEAEAGLLSQGWAEAKSHSATNWSERLPPERPSLSAAVSPASLATEGLKGRSPNDPDVTSFE